MLWWWCINYAEDGNLARYTPTQIASACDWEGSAKELLQHLADCGFIDRDPLRIHDWLDFCGDLIKKRLEYKKAKSRRTKRLGKSLRKPENSQLTVTKPDRNQTEPDQPALKPSGASPVKMLIDLFHDKLTLKMGEKPASFNGGVLGRTFTVALKSQTVDEAKRRIDSWFESSDPFIQTNGFSPTMFCQKFSLLKGGPLHASKSTSNPHIRLTQNDPTRRAAYAE
jgi:hypothetical protein